MECWRPTTSSTELWHTEWTINGRPLWNEEGIETRLPVVLSRDHILSVGVVVTHWLWRTPSPLARPAATGAGSAAAGELLASVDTAKPVDVSKWCLAIKHSRAVLSDFEFSGDTVPFKPYSASR